MKPIRHLLLVSAAFAVTGCNLAPHYVRPDLPVPAETPQGPAYPAAQDAADPAALVDTAWREFFTDPRLRDVIALALTHNRDLRVAFANVEQARAQYRVQRADIFPTLGTSASATYRKSPQGAVSGADAGTDPVDVYSASMGVSAWEIDLFGRGRNLTKAAQEQFFAVVENRKAIQIALIAEVATAWLTLAADQERLQVARKTEASFRQTLELNQARFKGGIASELDVRRAATSLDRARSDIARLTTQIAQDQNALNLLAGATVSPALLPEALADSGVTLDRLPANLSSEVLLRRPDVVATEHQLIAANANIGAARARFFPRISLTAALGTISFGLSNLFAGGTGNWSIGSTAELPIFDFGRNAGNARLAEAKRDAMVAQYEKTLQTAFREVADSLARRGTIEEQLAAQLSLNDNSAVAYRLSEARFRAGIDGFLSTLDAQRSYYAAEQELISTRLVKEANAVEVYRALGGGLK